MPTSVSSLRNRRTGRRTSLRGAVSAGQVLLAQGEIDEADQEIEMALAIARGIGNPPQIWKTLVVLGDLRKAQERSKEAVEVYGEALTIIDRVAADLDDEKLRDTFLSSPHVQAIREASKA